MNQFELVKANVSVRDAAKLYGLIIGRNNMTNCPFHNDRHPSFYVQTDHFRCFGCGMHGDVIDLTAQLFKLSRFEAAQKLNSDFGINGDCEIKAKLEIGKDVCYENKNAYTAEQRCVQVLTEYSQLLRLWKRTLAPKTPDDPLDDRFVEACHHIEATDCWPQELDISYGDERKRIVNELLESRVIDKIEKRLSDQRKEVRDRAAS